MILIALGANLPSRFGNPENTLAAAKAELAKAGVAVLKSSRVYTTEPVPASDQPRYKNAVIEISTDLGPLALFGLLKSIEGDFGRVAAERNEARVLDLDILAYNAEILDRQELTIPHPRMHLRGFVLEPLREIAPDWMHPVLRRSAEELFHSLPEKVSRETLAGG